MRILGLDFGEKRIGLAISDPLGITAQGLGFCERTPDGGELARLRAVCAERSVERCVVGLPLRMSGEIGKKARETIEWVWRLEKALPCPVETWDERLTTRQVERVMLEHGLSRKKRKEKNDELAAILILQNYLDTRRPRPDAP